MSVPLKSLGLERRWPKLDRIQNEIASLERNLSRAEGEAQQARAQLGAAHERDIAAEAKAYRAGKAAPEPVHEPQVRAELEAAERRVAVTQHALQAAREDLGGFLAVHQSALYQDALEARDRIGREAARAAQEAQRSYSRYEGLSRTLKGLAPPPSIETGPPGSGDPPVMRTTNSFIGMVHTARQAGPDRGRIEQVLGYLVSLGGGEEEGGSDAA
jgi:hypothetical protein